MSAPDDTDERDRVVKAAAGAAFAVLHGRMTAPVETPTEPEISQHAARAMLAALQASTDCLQVFVDTGAIMSVDTHRLAQRFIRDSRRAIAAAEGR
jgi:hypothetical protein